MRVRLSKSGGGVDASPMSRSRSRVAVAVAERAVSRSRVESRRVASVAVACGGRVHVLAAGHVHHRGAIWGLRQDVLSATDASTARIVKKH